MATLGSPRNLVLCAFLSAANLLAQEPTVILHPGGEVNERFTTNEAGKRNGLYERFDPDGTCLERSNYRDGQLHGDSETFDPQGRPVLEVRYSKGKRTGRSRQFRNGILVQAANYRRGQLNGRFESFDDDGTRLLKANYRGGDLHGKFEQWIPARDLHRKGSYADGALHGKATISIAGKTASKRIWDHGRLVALDGITAMPISKPDLESVLAEALKPGEPDAKDAHGPARQQALARLKAFRALCGVPWRDMSLVPEWNDLCDAASEVCAANGGLSHTPKRPPGFDEARYQKGYLGAKSSNLHRGQTLPGSVAGYMDDSDPTNIDRVGHRRWCLSPTMKQTGFGFSNGWTAMWAFDRSGNAPGGVKDIYYPPPGYVPVNFFRPRTAWSISPTNGTLRATEEEIRITVHELDDLYLPKGNALPLDYLGISTSGTGSGACLIFRPTGVTPQAGRRYRCQISFDSGRTIAHHYVVEFTEVVRPKASG